jgi:hypothetical protein
MRSSPRESEIEGKRRQVIADPVGSSQQGAYSTLLASSEVASEYLVCIDGCHVSTLPTPDLAACFIENPFVILQPDFPGRFRIK